MFKMCLILDLKRSHDTILKGARIGEHPLMFKKCSIFLSVMLGFGFYKAPPTEKAKVL